MRRLTATLMLLAMPATAADFTFDAIPSAVEYDASGIALSAETLSLSIEDAATAEVYGCTDVDPAVVVPVTIVATIDGPTSGQRAKVNAYAYAEAGCTGLKSDASAEYGVVFFSGPNAPRLVLK